MSWPGLTTAIAPGCQHSCLDELEGDRSHGVRARSSVLASGATATLGTTAPKHHSTGPQKSALHERTSVSCSCINTAVKLKQNVWPSKNCQPLRRRVNTQDRDNALFSLARFAVAFGSQTSCTSTSLQSEAHERRALEAGHLQRTEPQDTCLDVHSKLVASALHSP